MEHTKWRAGLIALTLAAFVTAFNYGGCGGSSSGSSGTPTPTAPAQVTSPSPTTGATAMPITQQLSWAAASGATSYDVYFGQTSPGTLIGNQTGLTYNPVTLTYSTVISLTYPNPLSSECFS